MVACMNAQQSAFLQVLDLSNHAATGSSRVYANAIGCRGAKAIAKALEGNTSLKKVRVCGRLSSSLVMDEWVCL